MKFSIITVCKNSEKVLEGAIRSVLGQSYGDREYIIIDGGSVDGTMGIIEKYRNHIDILVHEQDQGIYDAMNKGIKVATGDIVYFLNSDDSLYDRHVLADVMAQFQMGNPAVVYGNIWLIQDSHQGVLKYDKVDKRFFLHNTICHQALFVRRSLFHDVGPFDERYEIYADLDWLLRAYSRFSLSFMYYDRMICCYTYQGVSSTAFYDKKYVLERMTILSKYSIRVRIALALKRMLGLI
jgi:glycosyltransferase involved in cell wall biosynthesis